MSLNMFRRLEVRLRGCQNPETAFHRFDFQGVRVFGYTGPIGLTRGHVYHVVLSHGFRTGPGGGIGFTGPRYLIEHSKENKLARTLPDPDAPIPGAPVRPLVLPLACATTLNSFTEVLNRRTAASFIAAVESSLVAKPISVFGAERGEAKDVLEAACAVYGLQLRPFLLREAGGERQGYRISLPVPKVLDRFEDMPGEIHRLLLAALTRIPAGRFDGALKALAEQPQMKLPPASSPSRQMLDKLQGRKEALKRIHTTSLARLRAMVEPKIPADSEIRLPIRESGDDIKCLVAVTNLATLGSLLGELMQQPIPNCIAEFRNVRLFLEIEDKGDRFSIGYGVRHMDRSQVGANTSIEKSQLK